ncbi:MAG: helix-turn-helix transcriptional regulator [Anaerovoracaceae bacterium]
MSTRLKELRANKGYTQIKIQFLTGIDQADYSKIESGKRYPTVEQAKRLSYVLDTSIDYIVGVTDDPKPYAKTKKER